MRAGITAAVFGLLLSVICSPLAAQTNPIPYLHNPLVPGATLPGGPGFTLTVNGAGFAQGAVVKWNDSARATTFVSNTKVTASILASDIATPGTIFVTVSNPAPGGGISNSVFFEVTTPTTSLAFTRTDTDFSSSIALPNALTVLDLTNNGTSYLAVANGVCPAELSCLLEKASVSIASNGWQFSNQAFTGAHPGFIASGDFNGDGLLDLITVNSAGYSILLNVSASNLGGWAPHKDYSLPAGCDGPSGELGDFNQDGHLDLVLPGSSGVCVLPGNGDGTFAAPIVSGSGTFDAVRAIGDLNGDGKLDLIVSNTFPGTISILLGNGDGTFQTPVTYSTGPFANFVAAGDFDGDGKLDLAVSNDPNISIFLGNGDGTFKTKVDYPAGVSTGYLAIGDYNGDGVLDLAVPDSLCSSIICPANGSVNVLLGNGDGTFQSHLDFATGGEPGAIATGEFEYSGEQGGPIGRAGFAVANQQDNTVSVFAALRSGPTNPIPTISSISPTSAPVNSGAFTLTVNGSNFVSGSTVLFGGAQLPTTFVSANQLAAAISASSLSVAGSYSIIVRNPIPGGGDSTAIPFTLYGPTPTILSLSPSSVVAGGPAFTLTVNGSNFTSGATIGVGISGVDSTTFVTSTQLTIAIPASGITNPATINISVTNPPVNGLGGGTSGTLPFTVLPTNTQPVVGALVPASATAGSPAFTLILAGGGFTTSSVVTFNSSVVSSAFVSASQLQAAIPASAISVGGTPFVSVANPGGAPSLLVSFIVNNPVPSAGNLSPASLPAGNAAATLNVTGTNFNASSTVRVNGSSRVTTYVSSTSLNAALLASDFAHSGALNITVNNPTPAGGTSSALTFTVEDFKVNVQTPMSSVPAGQPASFSLMVVPANTTTSNAVNFSVAGLPAGATASFSPSATIPAGSGTTPVTLSITTTAHSVASGFKSPRASWPRGTSLYLAALLIAFMWIGLRVLNLGMRRLAPQFLLAGLFVLAGSLVACGGGSESATSFNSATGTPAGTYSITVTATSGNGSVNDTVMLTVM